MVSLVFMINLGPHGHTCPPGSSSLHVYSGPLGHHGALSHNRATAASSKKVAGWILRSFNTREIKPVMTPFKALIL